MNTTVDYNGLCDLARSKGIEVVEANGLQDRNGLRFQREGKDWIALDSSLSESEKARALGFLLENYSQGTGPEELSSGHDTSEQQQVYSLKCPRA